MTNKKAGRLHHARRTNKGHYDDIIICLDEAEKLLRPQRSRKRRTVLLSSFLVLLSALAVLSWQQRHNNNNNSHDSTLAIRRSFTEQAEREKPSAATSTNTSTIILQYNVSDEQAHFEKQQQQGCQFSFSDTCRRSIELAQQSVWNLSIIDTIPFANIPYLRKQDYDVIFDTAEMIVPDDSQQSVVQQQHQQHQQHQNRPPLLAYRKTAKAGSKFLQRIFSQVVGCAPLEYLEKSIDSNASSSLQEFHDKLEQRGCQDWGKRLNLVWFTFVRDPLSRMISAYGEVDANYAARGMEGNNPRLITPPLSTFNLMERNNGTNTMIRRLDAFLEDVFHTHHLLDPIYINYKLAPWGRSSYRYWLGNHAYPAIMKFIMSPNTKIFVGKIENMNEHWKLLQDQFRNLQEDFPKINHGGDASSSSSSSSSSHYSTKALVLPDYIAETNREMPLNEALLHHHLSNKGANSPYIKRWVVEVGKRMRSNETILNKRHTKTTSVPRQNDQTLTCYNDNTADENYFAVN